MLCYVFRPKGSRVFRGRYRLSNGRRIYDVSLGVDKRHVAEAKLHKIRQEREAELLGQLPPRALREAAQMSFASHLDDYVADLAGQGRSRKHVALTRNRVGRLANACGWSFVHQVTPDSFSAWRAEQALAPKTTNEYLGLANAFFNWMQRHGRLAVNPLANVRKAETRGKERRVRRALSDDEIARLIRFSGKRALVYLIAAYTGLRRGEMKALRWSDVYLDATEPYLMTRASTSKNHKDEPLPLHPELVNALRPLRPASGEMTGKVFAGGVPSAKTLRRDLSAAGITATNGIGAQVDFHALRHTWCTTLQRYGVAPRVAQQVMRHSDGRLTSKIYTDAALLPLGHEIRKVKVPSLGASLNSGKTCPGVSKAGQVPAIASVSETPSHEEDGLVLATDDHTWPNAENGGEGGIRTHPPAPPSFDATAVCAPEKPKPSQGASLNLGDARPELAELVAIWPRLSVPLRAALLATARAAEHAASDQRERSPRDEASTGIRCEAGPSEGQGAPEGSEPAPSKQEERCGKEDDRA